MTFPALLALQLAKVEFVKTTADPVTVVLRQKLLQQEHTDRGETREENENETMTTSATTVSSPY